MYLIHRSNALLRLLLITCLLLLLLVLQHPSSCCQAYEFCSPLSANYTSGSQFESNLKNLLLPSLVSNVSVTGFLSNTINISDNNNGDGTVYGLVQCRGDISVEDCKSCLNSASVDIIQKCPNRKDAAKRYEKCLLRYSNVRFFSQADCEHKFVVCNVANTTVNPADFSRELGNFMNVMISTAGSKPSKFETGSSRFENFGKIYGLVQCTQDLSNDSCITCLTTLLEHILKYKDLMVKTGVRVLCMSCVLRFEDYPFYQLLVSPPPPPPSPAPSPFPPPPDLPSHFSLIFGVIVVPIVAGVTLLALCVYMCKKRKRKNKQAQSGIKGGIHRDDIGSADSLQFDLHTIKIATNNFSDANKLGEGGFGVVYKGELLDKQEVAVKRLSSHSGQGSQEFKNEVVLLHGLQHRNLVRLLGFCLKGEEKILIYEYVPNRSLDKYLFDHNKRSYFDWETRYRIIGGIARGLLYLHEDSRLRVIHRDLKAGNILLDEEMNAKIADFGMAKLFGVDQTQGNTSRIAGTFGYMAPEYVMKGFFSVKSDVYSFGVLLLEIISGQNISSFHQAGQSQDLLTYAWRHWREGASLELMDPNLKDSFKRDEVIRCIHIGLLCVQDKIDLRPTMSSVVLMLNSYSVTLSAPIEPAFFALSITSKSETTISE